jgi:DNA ligase-associated metallophosphoesterase
MNVPICYRLRENSFWLTPQRTIFWEEENALIMSDLHFGKTGHFRKSGIGVPQNVFKEDIQRLVNQISYYHPKQLIIAGDLFHSEANKELDLFVKWRKDFPAILFHLIKGNHDILKDEWYGQSDILIHRNELTIGSFRFVHDIHTATESSGVYSFSGHIHPGIIISGIAKQHLRFPCFYFGETYAILPAYSRFTGLKIIEPKQKETVYAITDDSIIKIQ